MPPIKCDSSSQWDSPQVIAAEEGGTLDGSPSSQAEMTTGPKDCSAYSGDNMPHPRFLLLGPTGETNQHNHVVK